LASARSAARRSCSDRGEPNTRHSAYSLEARQLHIRGIRFFGGPTNPVEIAIRPICLTRKNALFAGHEIGAENWALLASTVATCKLNDVNPIAYIAETLEVIIAGHPQSKVDDLMPWRFRKTSSQHQ